MQVDSQARQKSLVEKPVSSGGIVPGFLRSEKAPALKGAVEHNSLLKSGQNCYGLTHQERYAVHPGVMPAHARTFPQT